jgi:hypothetical protein
MVAGVSDEDGAAAEALVRRATGTPVDAAATAGPVDAAVMGAPVDAAATAAPRAGVAWMHARGLPDAPPRGFRVELDGAPATEGDALFCPEVRGFDEALRAASDGRLAPPRLALASVDSAAAGWLEAWSEDPEAVERTVRVARLADGASLTVVATLAIFGPGVDTSLAVAAVAPDTRAPRPPLDSGVYMTVR